MQVQAFQIDALPISNVDYYTFLMQLDTPRPELFLSSWSGSMEKIEIKTIYGLVSFAVGQHWPATASAVQFDAYAKVRFVPFVLSFERELTSLRSTVAKRTTSDRV